MHHFATADYVASSPVYEKHYQCVAELIFVTGMNKVAYELRD